MITIDFSIPLAAIGVAAISWKSILDWKNSKKMHMVTNSDWREVTEEIRKLREDSDKHQAILTELETGFKFIKEMLMKINVNTEKPESLPLESEIKELKSDIKSIRKALEKKSNKISV